MDVDQIRYEIEAQCRALRRKWNALPDGMQCVVGGCVGVSLALRAPLLGRMVHTHTHASWNTVRRRWYTVFFSPFAHTGLLHLGVNCYMAANFVPYIEGRMYREKKADISVPNQAALFLVCSAVLAQVGGLLISRVPPLAHYPSIGISGGLYAVLTLWTLSEPESSLRLLWFPEPIQAQTLMACLIAADFANLMYVIIARNPTSVASHVHLSGAAVGAAAHYALPKKRDSWLW